jgi:hypothetical protein
MRCFPVDGEGDLRSAGPHERQDELGADLQLGQGAADAPQVFVTLCVVDGESSSGTDRAGERSVRVEWVAAVAPGHPADAVPAQRDELTRVLVDLDETGAVSAERSTSIRHAVCWISSGSESARRASERLIRNALSSAACCRVFASSSCAPTRARSSREENGLTM